MDEWITKYLMCIYTWWDIIQPEKENSVLCDTMNEPRGHYTDNKWNKPDRGTQTLYVFTYMWNLKTLNTERVEGGCQG